MKRIDPDNYQKPSKFMRFEVGDNRVRILSDGFCYYKLSVKAGGRYIPHIIREGEDIPDLFSKAEPKLSFGWVVYSFRDKSLKILECGPMLGEQLVDLTKDPAYQQKDIVINRTGTDMHTTKYAVKFAPDKEKLPHIGKTEAHLYLKYFEGEV